MSKTSNTKTLGLLAFVVVSLGGGATYYQYGEVQKLKAEVTSLEAQVPSQEDLERDLSDSQMKLATYQGQLAHLEGSVPDVAYVPTLMKELERIGLDHGIVVTGVRPAPVMAAPSFSKEEGSVKDKKKDYNEIQIEIKGRGEYDDIKSLLDALQKFPKIIAVKTLALTPIRDSLKNTVTDLEAVINVDAYVFPFDMKTVADEKPSGKVGEQAVRLLEEPSEPEATDSEGEKPEQAKKTSSSQKTGGRH